MSMLTIILCLLTPVALASAVLSPVILCNALFLSGTGRGALSGAAAAGYLAVPGPIVIFGFTLLAKLRHGYTNAVRSRLLGLYAASSVWCGIALLWLRFGAGPALGPLAMLCMVLILMIPVIVTVLTRPEAD